MHCRCIQGLYKTGEGTGIGDEQHSFILPLKAPASLGKSVRDMSRRLHIVELEELKQGLFSTISNCFDSKKWNREASIYVTVDETDPV